MILARYEELCRERGEYPSTVCSVAGYDKSALTNWRKQAAENDGMCSISSARLRLIAQHLDTTSDYLLGLSDESHPSAPSIVEELTRNPRKMLLFDETEGLSDKSMEQVIRMVRMIKGLQDD